MKMRTLFTILALASACSFASAAGDEEAVAVRLYPYYFNQEVVVQIDPGAWSALPAKTVMAVGLAASGQEEALRRFRVELPPGGGPLEAELRVGELAPGQYEVRVSPLNGNGNAAGKARAATLVWPERPSWPETGKKVRVLNNLVTELLNVRRQSSPLEEEYEFTNPRKGWIFVSSRADLVSTDGLQVSLEADPAEATLIVHDQGREPVQEAMRFLSAGKHKLRVDRQGKSSLQELIVRAIPELGFAYLTHSSYPYVYEYGPYDWFFLEDHGILKNTNTLVAGTWDWTIPHTKEWQRQGKKNLGGFSLPGLSDHSNPVSAEETYEEWAEYLKLPLVDGITADEFVGWNHISYPAWTEALRRIHEDERLKDKTYYAYTYAPPYNGGESAKTFFRALMDYGYRMAWERYRSEPPTRVAARKFVTASFKDQMLASEQNLPGCTKHTLMCLSIFSSAKLTANTDPAVDYKVYLDMQFHHVANDPAFWGLAGFFPWGAAYADEEVLRWLSQLYRHYCIEGNTEMLSRDPYELGHIKNPDFAQGLEGWTVLPADKGTIEARNLPGYASSVQGRWPEGKDAAAGDSFLWMKRHVAAPNTVVQEITGLQPGRLYSFKMYTRDHLHPEVKQKLAVDIQLKSVELIPEKCFQHAFESREAGWLNYHRLIFRARDTHARLKISDWKMDKSKDFFEPTGHSYVGAPKDQEIMYNFVEVQPYLED